MRTRLLANPGALADYEIVEMVLFLGIPRRDTKPQAKGLILDFGTLAAAFGAERDDLAERGFPDRVLDAFALVGQSATALARAERSERVALSDWDALDRYLDPSRRHARENGLSALLLNNRNQLLAECVLPVEQPTRALARHALDRHATAAILVRDGADMVPREADRRLLSDARASTQALSLCVHDMVLVTPEGWLSLEQDRTCSAG